MNDAPRQKLREIIERHGRSITEDPRRFEGLLRDYCAPFKREVSVLVMALEEHAVADMMAASSTLARRVLMNRLSQRLTDNLALAEPAANWSIESWALALGLVTDAELAGSRSEMGDVPKNEPTSNNGAALAPGFSVPLQTSHPQQTAATRPARVVSASGVFVVSPVGGDFPTINDALRQVPPDSRLVVREGIYNEGIHIDQNIEIAGDGDLGKIVLRSADRSCITMTAQKVTVSGLTLQGRGRPHGNSFFGVDVQRGELRLENCDVTSDSLSCIGIHGVEARPRIRNCRIHDGADSGIYIFDNARALIDDCDIYRNTNVNVAVTRGANPHLKNCRVFEGRNGGIVVWGNGAAGTFEDCDIYAHRLANVGVRESANPVFRRCRITGGRDSGVLVQQIAYGTFEECDIFRNAKAEVAITDESNTILRQCNVHHGNELGVFVGNGARALLEICSIDDNDDAGVAVDGGSVAAIRGCHIRRNGTVAVRVKGGSAVSVEGCDLRGNRVATWESDHGTVLERKNNRER